MSTYLQLTSHYVENRGDQVVVFDPSVTARFSDGTAVQFPLPFMRIGNGLALVPRVKGADVGVSVQIDFSQWSPARIANGKTQVLPVGLPDQALAVRLCQEFHADPDTTWDDPSDKTAAWVTTWLQVNRSDAGRPTK
ncbi:hypothetical protein ACVDFE_35870 [Lentzea chajnantorensis]